MKKCVFVLGMHRSGTSALTGVLDKLGVSLGTDLLPAADDNPRGFFENRKVVELNEKIFAAINTTYDDTRYEVDFPAELVDRFAKEAGGVIRDQFRYSKIFAIKDPRLCLTFPVWSKAIKKQKIDAQVIIPYRNPMEVALSLKKRNDFSLDKSLILWLKYFFHAECYSREYERLFVSFDQLVSEPVKTSISVRTFLDSEGDVLVHSDDVKGFLDKKLKHENVRINNLEDNLPFFLKKVIGIVNGRLMLETSARDYDAIREEFLSSYSMFHAYDVLYHTQLSRDLHYQRDEARRNLEQRNESARKVEIELDENRKAVEQQIQLLSEKESVLAALEQQRAALQHSLDVKFHEAEQQRSSLNQLKEDQHLLEESNRVLIGENENQGRVLSEKESVLAELEQRRTALEHSLDRKCHEAEQLRTDLNRLQEDQHLLEERNRLLVGETENQGRLLSEKDSVFAELEQQRAALQNRLDAKSLESEGLSIKLDSLQNKIRALTETNDDQARSLASTQATLSQLQQQNTELQESLVAKVREVDNLRDQIDCIVKDLAIVKERKAISGKAFRTIRNFLTE